MNPGVHHNLKCTDRSAKLSKSSGRLRQHIYLFPLQVLHHVKQAAASHTFIHDTVIY